MIEWKKYEVMRGPQFPKGKVFLVTDGKRVVQAVHDFERGHGYQWWDAEGVMVGNVSHYAEINLPEEMNRE